MNNYLSICFLIDCCQLEQLWHFLISHMIWRMREIMSNTFVSWSHWLMMNLCDLSFVRPMRTVYSVPSWKASLSSFILTWVWRTAQSTPSPPCSSLRDLDSPCQVPSLGTTGPSSSPTTQHTSLCCWPKPNQPKVSHQWDRMLLFFHQWCRTWVSMMVSRESCLATTWFSGFISWCLWTL